MSSAPKPGEVTWRKSTRSAYNGNCVEVAFGTEGVAVRDSKDPHGAVLTFDRAAWAALIDAIKQGQLARQ